MQTLDRTLRTVPVEFAYHNHRGVLRQRGKARLGIRRRLGSDRRGRDVDQCRDAVTVQIDQRCDSGEQRVRRHLDPQGVAERSAGVLDEPLDVFISVGCRIVQLREPLAQSNFGYRVPPK